MNKKLLTIALFLLTGLLVFSGNVFAAAADITFSTTSYVNLTGVNNHNLTITAGSTIESMVVGTNTVVLTLGVGDTITFTSANKYLMTTTSDTFTTTCGASESTITITSSTTLTVSTNTCPGSVSGGGGGGGGSPAPTPTPEPEPEPEPTETVSGEGTVTAGGGGSVSATTNTGGQASVSFPVNAVVSDTTVSVVPTATSDSGLSAAMSSVSSGKGVIGGYVYDYSAVLAGESVTSFDESMTITMTYTDDQVSGFDESSLQIQYWDATAWEWVGLSTIINTDTNTLTATTDHFTYFAIIGDEVEQETEIVCADFMDETECTGGSCFWYDDVCNTQEQQVPASEMTIEELKAKILELQQLIAVAMARLAALLGTSPITGIPSTFSFTANMSQNESSDAVKYLQIMLNSSADTKVANTGVGSPGSETMYFGSLTKSAVIKFQEKYSSVVLDPWGFTSGTGFVGSTTREKLNSLLGK